ncbi:MAG TPA: carboxypeptidase-like regulatory domain-containing protein, partial [Terriglobales bacterium]|nr:carboxypeptidase-like regulatory domain-containing protein [Terriglobales bacterium]
MTRFPRRTPSSALILVLLLTILPLMAFAQTTTEGAISGTVSDTTGAVVSDASVVVRNNATNAEQTTKTDPSGDFRVGNLAPSVYTVTVNATGFAAYKLEQVIVNVGTVTDISPK